MYLYVIHMSLACNRMSSVFDTYVLVCHSYVHTCHSYVTRVYLYVTHMSLVYHSYVTRMSLVCGFTINHLDMETQNVAWSLDPLDFLCNKAFSFINLFLAEGTLINSGNVALANSYFNWQCLVSRCIKHFCNNNAFSFVNLF